MYELIKLLERENLFNKLINGGLLSTTIVGQKEVYEVFLSEKCKGHGTYKAVTNTSVKTGRSESTIYKIIKRMRRGI